MLHPPTNPGNLSSGDGPLVGTDHILMKKADAFKVILISYKRSNSEPLEWEHWLQDPRLPDN